MPDKYDTLEVTLEPAENADTFHANVLVGDGNQAVNGAQVELSTVDGSVHAYTKTLTVESGSVQFNDVPDAVFDVSVTAQGYQTFNDEWDPQWSEA